MKEETKATLAGVPATLTLQLLKRGIRNTYMSGVAHWDRWWNGW